MHQVLKKVLNIEKFTKSCEIDAISQVYQVEIINTASKSICSRSL